MTCIRLRAISAAFAAIFVFSSLPASAQVTNGTIAGRVVDQQRQPIPGVVVLATHTDAGFPREATTDAAGNYRLAALPIGTYEVVVSMAGFQRYRSVATINVGLNVPLDIELMVGPVTEAVTVEAPAPRASSIELVAEPFRVQSVPLTDRHLAGVAGTLPGIGNGQHPDPARNSRTVQAIGMNGRGISMMVDGGDNNDDTIGAESLFFPLEAIQEFKVLQRFDAEYGRGGAILNVISKSGTNELRGSWFGLFRHDAMNARTFSEQLADVSKQSYQRSQYGGSIGGPIVLNRAHFFVAFERTQQDTRQLVDTGGIYPDEDNRVHDLPFRQNLLHAKVTIVPRPSQYLAFRYARDHNTQPSGVGLRVASSTWVTSTNDYNSLNANHNWVTGRTSLNEIVGQVSSYTNETPGSGSGPALMFPNGTSGGANANAPQATEQTKWQVRDDYSWSMSGLGISHEIRTGISWIHEPRLFVSNQGGTDGLFWMLSNDPNGPVQRILLIGGTVSSNIPLDAFGTYIQDDWRVNDRLTLNLGVRWDYLKGMPIEQTSANFLAMQAAGQAGRFAGTFLDDFGKSPRGDRDNVQPRLGFVYDLGGNGRHLVRGGWGIYSDRSYTNQNVLTTSLEGGGIILSVVNPSGILKADMTPFRATDPIESLGLPLLSPTTGEVVSPRLEEPFSYQTNFGYSRELSRSTTFSVDYLNAEGRNINMRVRPNVDTDPTGATVRFLGDVGITPNDSSFRTAVSAGRSSYHALILAAHRRMTDGFDFSASYTLAHATSTVGAASDEMAQNLIQNIDDPFGAFQDGPSTRTDARHRITVSSIMQLPLAIQAAPVFRFHSALPVTTLEGIDLNADLNNNDHTPRAYRYTGLNDDGSARFEDMGACETVNCSRRAPFAQLDLRVSRGFSLMGHARIEAIVEVFNVFNAKNPYIGLSSQRLTRTSGGDIVELPSFMQPTAYAGDVGQGEQRIGQVGFRLSF